MKGEGREIGVKNGHFFTLSDFHFAAIKVEKKGPEIFAKINSNIGKIGFLGSLDPRFVYFLG